jgi:predicted nucleotidyltransferase
MLNEDYRDILQALSDENVEFLLVGAYALAAHGYPRATMDIDIWVKPSADNAVALLRALKRFGAPLHGLTKSDLQKDDTIFQIGVAPRRIDIITGASGLKFEEAFSRSVGVDIDGLHLRILSLKDLIANKRAVGRKKDLADLEALGEAP